MLSSITSLLVIATLTVTVEDNSEARIWTDSTGKFTVNAVLIEVDSSKQVRLRRVDSGTEISLPLARLSQADLDYLGTLAERSTAEKRVLFVEEVDKWDPVNPYLHKNEISLRRVPILNFLEEIQESGGNIWIEEAALKRASINIKQPYKGKPERLLPIDALNKIIEASGIDLEVLGEVLLITSYRTTRHPMRLSIHRAYRHNDLPVDKLVSAIKREVVPGSWTERKGPGKLIVVPGPLELVFFKNSYGISERMERRFPVSLETYGFNISVRNPDLEQHQSVGRDLKQRYLSIKVDRQPLSRVLAEIGKTLEIKLELDPGVDPLISGQFRGARLSSALSLLVHEHDLDWIPDNDRIFVGHRDHPLIVKSYDFCHWAETESDKEKLAQVLSSLGVDSRKYLEWLLAELVDPKSWQKNGGAATISWQDDGLLVRNQCWRNHHQIRMIIEGLGGSHHKL